MRFYLALGVQRIKAQTRRQRLIWNRQAAREQAGFLAFVSEAEPVVTGIAYLPVIKVLNIIRTGADEQALDAFALWAM